MDFIPLTRIGKNIAKELIEFSKERKISINMIDFELISFSTYIQRPNEIYTAVKDITTITDSDIKNSNTPIEQEYSIKIFPKKQQENQIKMILSLNDLKTKAIVTIKKGSEFQEKENLFQELKSQIWYLKLRAGLLIELFEDRLENQLKKLLTIVPYDKELSKDIKMSVAVGLVPTAPVDTSIEKIYEENMKDNDSLISGVDKGELIFRFTKSKFGTGGRSCTGRYLAPKDTKSVLQRPIVDHSVEEKEDDKCIEYFAHDNGYVHYEKDQLSVLEKQLSETKEND